MGERRLEMRHARNSAHAQDKVPSPSKPSRLLGHSSLPRRSLQEQQQQRRRDDDDDDGDNNNIQSPIPVIVWVSVRASKNRNEARGEREETNLRLVLV